MDIIFLFVVVFLLLLAVFDLSVGVSNDAVNFLNSAIGSKAASFRRILIVASIGVFIGAAMSNGMMDIARHGIFRPEHFSFYDLTCIFMAVMVTDIILLDIFNSLGMPTSTTVSMVFELLGATFMVSLIKMANDATGLGLSELINTEKALSVIIGIFLSVAIAFFFGTLVQFITRMLFSFNYKSRLKWKIGLFGGICATAIIYFLLIKGTKELSFMTPEIKEWISENTGKIIVCSLVGFTLLMHLLHTLFKVNVLKVIVLMGTFSLAMAFAGNDLVNFIGVPLTGLASYQDYMANGGGNATGFLMDSLNGPSTTSVWFLVGSGVIMVVSLATSKKARKVSQTEVGLGSQSGGDEMFGSSRIARSIVRWTMSFFGLIHRLTPIKARTWFNGRFNVDETIMEQGASFDLVRGAVNLVLAGTLIALGTSMKLPLSTTFVTFMVAMGTSLADRAWSRESAVFRITGVISVIGGWFLTAGAAFIGAGIIGAMMYYGGQCAMIFLAALTIFIIFQSNRRFLHKQVEEQGDVLFQSIISCKNREDVWPAFLLYLTSRQQRFIALAEESYNVMTNAFVREDLRSMDRIEEKLQGEKATLKNDRRKETLCLRQLPHELAIEKSTWFYLGNNCCMSILYNLRRINEICMEHLENNFAPLPSSYLDDFESIRRQISVLFEETVCMMDTGNTNTINNIRTHCEAIKNTISDTYHRLYTSIRDDSPSSMTVFYVYLNMLQETREMVSTIRKYIRSFAKMRDNDYSGRSI